MTAPPDPFDPAANSHATWTLRLILATFTDDDDARATIAAEVDDCPSCWRAIATRTALYADLYACRCQSEDDAVAEVQRMLAATLDAGSAP